ncbi:hypothetical protein Enr13x_20960 [Stieleria neptunia]|uniref:Uncharacterized protein n=1 Tax=Stieleria neptunia TaxID=2527979 RepID=A0A518HN14_9BACT|nr:hypothetical protein Enr13x_20960 [Stieleria neptunia]
MHDVQWGRQVEVQTLPEWPHRLGEGKRGHPGALARRVENSHKRLLAALRRSIIWKIAINSLGQTGAKQMLDVDDLVRLWAIRREMLQAIADYNLKMAQTRTEIWRSFQAQHVAGALLLYKRQILQSQKEHKKHMAALRKQVRTLNRHRNIHYSSAASLSVYPSAAQLSPPSITRLWSSLIYIGSRSPLVPPDARLYTEIPESLRSPENYFSPSRNQSPTEQPPDHIRRVAELAGWLRTWNMVPLGGTPADQLFEDLIQTYIRSARESGARVQTQAESIRSRTNELNTEFFKQNLEIPRSLGIGTAKK